jgi:hypothetical protein
MKGSTNYSGTALPQQSAGAYGEALTGSSGALSGGAGYAGQAGNLFSQFGGMTPSDISTQSLPQMDLSGYMNPFQQQVTDATMEELRRQQQISDQGVRDQATAARSFGGDRMQVQQSENARNYGDMRARTLSALNSANFNNAQGMATSDAARKLQADSSNQNMRYGMSQAGAGGLSGLGMGGMQAGLGGLSNLANMGFGFGNELNKNQLAAGSMQQQLMQSIIDASKGQYGGWSGAPQDALSMLSQALGVNIGNAGTSTGTTKTPGPSTWDKVLGGAQAVGSLLPW